MKTYTARYQANPGTIRVNDLCRNSLHEIGRVDKIGHLPWGFNYKLIALHSTPFTIKGEVIEARLQDLTRLGNLMLFDGKKPVGTVSYHALWVKENDQFVETEVNIIIAPSSIPASDDTARFNICKIKGACGHFHQDHTGQARILFGLLKLYGPHPYIFLYVMTPAETNKQINDLSATIGFLADQKLKHRQQITDIENQIVTIQTFHSPHTVTV